jgi:hypothetical protein
MSCHGLVLSGSAVARWDMDASDATREPSFLGSQTEEDDLDVDADADAEEALERRKKALLAITACVLPLSSSDD